jgi:hypothetical protein
MMFISIYKFGAQLAMLESDVHTVKALAQTALDTQIELNNLVHDSENIQVPSTGYNSNYLRNPNLNQNLPNLSVHSSSDETGDAGRVALKSQASRRGRDEDVEHEPHATRQTVQIPRPQQHRKQGSEHGEVSIPSRRAVPVEGPPLESRQLSRDVPLRSSGVMDVSPVSSLGSAALTMHDRTYTESTQWDSDVNINRRFGHVDIQRQFAPGSFAGESATIHSPDSSEGGSSPSYSDTRTDPRGQQSNLQHPENIQNAQQREQVTGKPSYLARDVYHSDIFTSLHVDQYRGDFQTAEERDTHVGARHSQTSMPSDVGGAIDIRLEQLQQEKERIQSLLSQRKHESQLRK